MAQNYMCKLHCRYWFDGIEVYFRFTDWSLVGEKTDKDFVWETCTPNKEWVSKLIDVAMVRALKKM